MPQKLHLLLFILQLFVLSLIPTSSIGGGSEQGEENGGDQRRIYDFKAVNGAGCPYTASWLADINLFRHIVWYVDSTKMEAASFRIFDVAQKKFQVADPDAYYVHHMSMYEHHIHRKLGFETAQRETLILSKAAQKGECNNLKVRPTSEFMALIPFFGGLPPGVTKDFSKVQSIGQGNSLVNASTKAMQCMATLCSTLKYYGHAVIAVVRDSDRELMLKTIDSLPPQVRAHTAVLQLAVPKNANLPFHTLAWAQLFVKQHNCRLLNQAIPSTATPFYYHPPGSTAASSASKTTAISTTSAVVAASATSTGTTATATVTTPVPPPLSTTSSLPVSTSTTSSSSSSSSIVGQLANIDVITKRIIRDLNITSAAASASAAISTLLSSLVINKHSKDSIAESFLPKTSTVPIPGGGDDGGGNDNQNNTTASSSHTSTGNSHTQQPQQRRRRLRAREMLVAPVEGTSYTPDHPLMQICTPDGLVSPKVGTSPHFTYPIPYSHTLVKYLMLT